MHSRLSAGAAATLLLLVGCSSKRDLGNIPAGSGGKTGTAGTGSGSAGQGGVSGGAAGTGDAGGGGLSGSGGGGGGGGAGAAAGTGGSSGQGGGPSTCDISRPFGTPVLVAGVNQDGSDDITARLSADELTIFFASDRSGNREIYTASRTSQTSSFGTPQLLAGVNSPSADAYPSLTADGLTLFLESDRGGVFQVLGASRSNTLAQFSTPSPVPNVNAGSNDGQSYVLPDKSALYFVSFRTGGGDIYRAPLETGGQFGAPVMVSTINTPSADYIPTPTADELTLYYASNRADSPAKGGFDIWMTKRSSPGAAFDPPVKASSMKA